MRKYFLHTIIIIFGIVPLITYSQTAPFAFELQNNQACDKVFGQPNFVTNAGNSTRDGQDNAYHTAVDPVTGKVFVSDLGNNRVLRYSGINAFQNGDLAEAVLGQVNFTNNGAAVAQNRMNSPTGIFLGPTGVLWVTDWGNNRVLKFNNAVTLGSGANANGVLGQTNFTNNGGGTAQNRTSRPIACFEENDGTLWVADQGNDRVLRFDNAVAKANGANADGVLGKNNFTTLGDQTTQNGLANPTGVSVNDAGRLYVSDQFNDRIIWWDNAKVQANGANANGQLGQPNFTTGTTGLSRFEMSSPRMVTVTPDNKFLAVADDDNNRILIYINPNTSGEINADFVFGQTTFTTNAANNGGLSAASISNPRGVFLYQTTAFENYLFVSDRGNNRTKVYVLFDIFYTTDAFTPIVDTLQSTEIDGDPITYSVISTTNTGTFTLDNTTTGEFTYTPVLAPTDYTDTLVYQVCDADGCDTSLVIFNVLTPKRLWIKADDGTSPTMDKWVNQIPSGDTVYAQTGSEPTLVQNQINYNPSVSFNGTNEWMFSELGIINTLSDVHVSTFALTIPNSIKNQHVLEESSGSAIYGNIDVWGDGNSYFEAGAALEVGNPWGGTTGIPNIWSFTQSTAEESISRDGLEIATKAGGVVRGFGDSTLIGRDIAGNHYDGQIAEIMHFQHTDGKTFFNKEINTVESYFAIKYGITLDQANDNDNDGTAGTDYTLSDTLLTVWEDANANGYKFDIAGIGRDDFYGLNQKQSKSINSDAIITMAKTEFFVDNLTNPNIFGLDKQAMLWANNDSSINEWIESGIPFGYNTINRLKRQWKIEENVGDVGEVEVVIDNADLPANTLVANNLYVVIDEDLNGDFNDGNLRLIKLTKDGSGIWKGKGDFNDDEIFTLMYIEFDIMRNGKFFLNLDERPFDWINRDQ